MQEEEAPKKELSSMDQANLQKIKALKGNMSIQKMMTDLTNISRGPGTEEQKEAKAAKYLSGVMNQLTPLAQFVNNLGIKIPRQ